MLAGRPHTTCGGRSSWRNIIDTLYTLLVGGLDGAPIGDGVRQARRPSHTFPYLCSPNPEPPGLATLFPALAAPGSRRTGLTRTTDRMRPRDVRLH